MMTTMKRVTGPPLRRDRQPTDHRSKQGPANAAFSIVETVLALALMSLFVGGLCRLTLTTHMITDQAREQYQTVTLARNRLERIRVLPFDLAELFAESNVLVNDYGTPDPAGRFLRSTEVSSLGTDLTQVRVTLLAYNHLTGKFDGQTEELISCIARYQTKAEQ